MSYSTAKGYHAEVEAAEFFDSLVKPTFHVCRVGGIESRKMVLSGDVSILPSCRKHRFVGSTDIKDCFFYDCFIEVKCQARPNIWRDIQKAQDDAKIAGKSDVIGYFIQQPKGSKGKRLIAMTPETFKKIFGGRNKAS